MRTTFLTAAILSTALSGVLQAKEIPEAQFTYGNWSGTAYTDDQTGGFLYCNAVHNYAAGEVLEIAVYYDGTFSFYLLNPQIPRRAGDILEVTMMTQNSYPIYAKFEAIDNNYLSATFTDTSNVAPWLMNADSLRILGIEDDQAYMLDDVNNALIHVLGCAVERSNAEVAAPPSNVPATTAPTFPNTPGVGNKLPPPRKP